MKYILTLVVLIFAGCQLETRNEPDNPAKTYPVTDLTPRNLKVNRDNAYNNMFLDSSELNAFIRDADVTDSMASPITSFYNSRNYQYAWMHNGHINEDALFFWNMYKYNLGHHPQKVMKDSILTRIMNTLTSMEPGKSISANKLLDTELRLSYHFISFFRKNFKDQVTNRMLEEIIPVFRQDPIELARELVNRKNREARIPGHINPGYEALKNKVIEFLVTVDKGGWQDLQEDEKLYSRRKDSTAIRNLKKRLQLAGDLNQSDSSAAWSSSLTNAIKSFQHRFGYKPDGKPTIQQIRDLNVPVEVRLQQMLLNLYRIQWEMYEPDETLVRVNIPEFRLYVYNRDSLAFDMPVIVGKDANRTMIFTGNMNQVVFSPYWNIPESIVVNEILPALDRDPGYLARNHMEIMNEKPSSVPVIRQLPGEWNQLGRVKFLFPNSFDIYLHDTPAKWAFTKNKRALSHGCIRVAEPLRLAEYVLQNDTAWSQSKILDAMYGTEEKVVNLKKRIPVLITYYTSWVDKNGLLRFADDIYKHDSLRTTRMFGR